MNYKGYDIEITQDEFPYCPRENDNLGKIITYTRNYNIGDCENIKDRSDLYIELHSQSCENQSDYYQNMDFLGYNETTYLSDNEEACEKIIAELFKTNLVLPVYLYDHSGITINTTGFSCSWDSGQIGFICVKKSIIYNLYKVKILSPKIKKEVLTLLDNEIKEYDDYLTGNCHAYAIYDHDKNIDAKARTGIINI